MISELIEMSIGQCQALPALKIDESLSHCNYAKLEATSILKYQYLRNITVNCKQTDTLLTRCANLVGN